MAAEFHAPHLVNASKALQVARPKALTSTRSAKPSLGAEQIAWSGKQELMSKARSDRGPTWTLLDGGVVGSIQVRSQGAAALRLGLRLTNSAGVVVTVAGSGDATLGIPPQRMTDTQLGTSPGSIVWTPITSGEWQYVEVYLPGFRAVPNGEVIVIDDLSHFVRNPLAPDAPGKSDLHKLEPCHLNYDCLAEGPLRQAGRAVAKLTITTSEGSFLCSGALLADRYDTGTPYFATAHHCDVNSNSVAASVEFIWRYEQTCNGSSTNPNQSTTVGAVVLYADPNNDFTLLRLSGPLPGGLLLLGWDPNEPALGALVSGVHHPDGARKAYSSGEITAFRTISTGTGSSIRTVPAQKVSWLKGLTEGGSSGSPLLSGDGLFLGTLWSGNRPKVCGGENFSNYSRFSKVYVRARAWLDPSAETDDDWANSAGETQASQPIAFDTVSESGFLGYAADQDWFRFTFFEPGTWIVFGEDYGGAATDTVGRIVAADGQTLLAENDDDPFDGGGLHFAFHNQVSVPGTYYVQVTGYNGATGPYSLASVFVPADDHNDSLLLGTTLPANGTVSGGLSRDGDLDAFIVDLPSAGTLTVASSGSTDVMAALYGGDGSKIDFNDDAQYPDNLNFRMSRALPQGRYYVAVVGYDASARGGYAINATFSPSSVSTTPAAVEFYHSGFGHYFVSSIPADIAALDSGALGGWSRTGESFKVFQVNTQGAANVCRFFSNAFAPKSSHFYTPLVTECNAVKADPNWQFEGEVFALVSPDAAGNCAAGRAPLYRLYNNGLSGAPNHRYTVSQAIRNQMLAQGWLPEGFGPLGVIGCVPV